MKAWKLEAIAGTVLALIAQVHSQDINYDRTTAAVAPCVAAIDSISDAGTLDEMRAVDNGCRSIWSFVYKSKIEGEMDRHAKQEFQCHPPQELAMIRLVNNRFGEPFYPLLRALRKKMPLLKKIFKDAPAKYGVVVEPERLRELTLVFFSSLDKLYRWDAGWFGAQNCPTFPDYEALSNQFWEVVNETREINPAPVTTPSKYADWMKADIVRNRVLATFATCGIKNLPSPRWYTIPSNSSSALMISFIDGSYQVPVPGTAYYDQRPQAIAEADAWLRELVIPGYKSMIMELAQAWVAKKPALKGLDARSKNAMDYAVGTILSGTLYKYKIVYSTPISLDTPSYLELVKTVQPIFTAAVEWYNVCWPDEC